MDSGVCRRDFFMTQILIYLFPPSASRRRWASLAGWRRRRCHGGGGSGGGKGSECEACKQVGGVGWGWVEEVGEMGEGEFGREMEV